uniref:(northern house mosquito) hypothetical protein n=1 Tax=Culex pipiens TaxID=7175 RepID=A0A8D8B300_CULPI
MVGERPRESVLSKASNLNPEDVRLLAIFLARDRLLRPASFNRLRARKDRQVETSLHRSFPRYHQLLRDDLDPSRVQRQDRPSPSPRSGSLHGKHAESTATDHVSLPGHAGRPV